jgi:hypothetical protein
MEDSEFPFFELTVYNKKKIQNCKIFESHDETNYFIIEQSFLPMNENLTWTKCCPISSLGP